jgi:hypothetical protein
MTLINHANYQPTPHDMMIAMKTMADLAQEITGNVPTIKVGPHNLYPPVDGKPLDEKAAQAVYNAMYEGKGTISVNDKNVPVFRQSQGQITKDDCQLETKMAPSIVSPENEAAKEKYQELYASHPANGSLSMTYEDRLKISADAQKLADSMVKAMAFDEGMSPEDLSRVLGQGSAYINSNLEAVASEVPQVPEGIKYLAAMDSEYRSEFLKEAVVEPEPVLSTVESLEDNLSYVAPDNLPDFSDTILARSYARMDGIGNEINKRYEWAASPGYEYVVAPGTAEAPSEIDKLREQFAEAKSEFDSRLDALGIPRPELEPVAVDNAVSEPPIEVENDLSAYDRARAYSPPEEPDNWDERFQQSLAETGSLYGNMEQELQDYAEDNPYEMSAEDIEAQSSFDENLSPEEQQRRDQIVEEALAPDSLVDTQPIDLTEISKNLTSDQRFAPSAMPAPESVEATIVQLTAKIEALQTEMASIRKSMEKIANKEPIPKVRNWAKNKLDSVLTKLQDRAKTDIALTVEHGKNLAQKALDTIGNKLDQFQNNLLGLDKIHSDLKGVFEIHDNAPSVAVGEYTFNNDAGNISVSHKDRGEVFSITDKGASFAGQFNTNDYRMLSNVSEAVAVIAGPVAIAAEVAKDLAVGAVKGAVNEGAQKSAIRMG